MELRQTQHQLLSPFQKLAVEQQQAPSSQDCKRLRVCTDDALEVDVPTDVHNACSSLDSPDGLAVAGASSECPSRDEHCFLSDSDMAPVQPRSPSDHERLSPISRVLLAGNKKATLWSLQRRHHVTTRSSLAPRDDAEADACEVFDTDDVDSVVEMGCIALPGHSAGVLVNEVLMRRNRGSSASSGCTDLLVLS